MHPSEIVADFVVTEAQELVGNRSGNGESRPIVMSHAPSPGRKGCRSEFVHPGPHHDFGDATDGLVSTAQPEGIGDTDGHWPDPESPAAVRRDPVGGAGLLAGPQGSGEKARGPMAVVETVGDQQSRRRTGCGDLEVDPGVPAYVDAHRSDPSLDPDRHRSTPGPERSDQEQCAGSESEGHQLGGSEQSTCGEEAECRPEQRPAAPGEAGRRGCHPVSPSHQERAGHRAVRRSRRSRRPLAGRRRHSG